MVIEDRLNRLKERICGAEVYVTENMKKHFGKKAKYVIFISASDADSRAYVCKGRGNTVESSWKNAVDILYKHIREYELNPCWIKTDIVREIRAYSEKELHQYIAQFKSGFFREGISLDYMMNHAFMEQEVNGNGMLAKAKDGRLAVLDWSKIASYVRKNSKQTIEIEHDEKRAVYCFDTIGFFHDGYDCYDLYSDAINNGRRVVDIAEKAVIKGIIDKASHYLKSQVDPTGKFRYGYSPRWNKERNSYNIVRHAGTIYSMIESYEVSPDTGLKDAIERALGYLIDKNMEVFDNLVGESRAFVIERKNNELKLGANAASMLALTKYRTVFKDDRYSEITEKLALGIEYFQEEGGGFVHVLNSADLSVKDKYRIIYYDGEAAFALLRLYAIDHKERWLEIITRAFEHYIQNDYWRYHDHWLSYCSNEILKFKPDNKYVVFNLLNAEEILDKCQQKLIAQPVLLELLMATRNMIMRLACQENCIDAIEKFDKRKLDIAIEHRVKHQLNGFFFPEVAIYFKRPKAIEGSFFVREDAFRVRIDDVQHNLSGYCCYYQSLIADC